MRPRTDSGGARTEKLGTLGGHRPERRRDPVAQWAYRVAFSAEGWELLGHAT
jgi:hypothetical protein